jgi:hypothetical protein
MLRARTTLLLVWLAGSGLSLAAGAANAQVRRAPARTAVTRARLRVFSGLHPNAGAGQHTVAAPAVPPIPDFEKLQMTTYSLPGADVHGAGGSIRLTASQPVVHDGMMSVDGAITQPDFGRDGSVLFDDMTHHEPGTVRLHFRLTEVGRPHVLDCSVVNRPGVDWEVGVTNQTQVFKTGQSPTGDHLSVILVPAQPGDFLITVHPKLEAPTGDYVYAVLGYCEMTVLH